MSKLTNKSYKNYDKFSRYSSFPYYFHTVDNKYIYGTTQHLRDNIPYTIHTVKNGDNLDTLALKYYNNPTYYWIIADFNKINDPYIKLKEGMQIRIPSFSMLAFNI